MRLISTRRIISPSIQREGNFSVIWVDMVCPLPLEIGLAAITASVTSAEGSAISKFVWPARLPGRRYPIMR